IGTLSNQLQSYIKDTEIFICPSAPKPYTGDLQLFYVERSDNAVSDVFSIGCPYHRKHGVSVVLNHDGSAVLNRSAGVYRNTPSDIVNPGDQITGGTLYFADGSTARITGSARVKVIESFWRNSDNRLYSIIRIDAPQAQNQGQVEVQVTPGSKFEVVTPATIAGVEGTEFTVTVTEDASQYISDVSVSSGIVTVTTRDSNKETVKLYPGQNKNVKRNK
ncbi:MAG: FecR domain-containing protein, partial [Candidatus Omnitrophica bacterium]|nr:FecR domain-containing protein [Candidatus Omnitrophota bacterium]